MTSMLSYLRRRRALTFGGSLPEIRQHLHSRSQLLGAYSPRCAERHTWAYPTGVLAELPRGEATDNSPYFPVFPVLILKLMAGTMSSAVSTTLFVCTTFTVSTILSVSTEVGVAYFLR